MKITKQEVEHLARLAKISLTEAEKEKYQKQLSSVLDYVDQLKKVDTKNVDPTYQVTGLKNVLREDKVEKTAKELKEDLLKNVTKREKDFVETKGVFDN